MGIQKETTHICYHCGNTGVLKLISKIETPEYAEDYDEYGREIYRQLIEKTVWKLFQCPVCLKPVLISEYTFCGMPDEYSQIQNEYPAVNICYDGVPYKIKAAFESAVKTKGIDSAICLLSLRRTLEMICKDKNARGRDLETKIDDLVQQKVLPEMMRDACWIIRQNGNDAAHADDVTFTEYEVTEVIEYVATITNYLYSMPTRMTKLRKRIEDRKA